MRSYMKNHQLSRALVLSIGVLVCTAGNAWHADGYHGGGGGGYHGGGGGYYHGGGGYYHGGGGYYQGGGGWGGTGVVIGIPLGGAYGSSYYPSCSIVRQCYPDGECVEHQECD